MDRNGGTPRKAKTLSPRDISLFCSQVGLILEAGIPLADGIGAIEENIESSDGKEMVRRLRGKLEANGSFYAALRDSAVFPNYMVSMVEVGEKAGRLDNVVEVLAHYYDREDKLRHRVRNALLYPLLLVMMMAAVILLLLVKVLPIFNAVFLNLGSDVLSTAQSVTRIGTTIGQCALVLILLLAAVLIFLLAVSGRSAGGRSLPEPFLHFRPVKRIFRKIGSARLASVLSLLLSSGYDITETFELARRIFSDREMLRKIKQIKKDVDSGVSVSSAMEHAGVFPAVYSGMIRLGAKTGTLDSVMKQLAELSGEEADASIERAISVIEPAMVAALSVVIGGILLSVMLPLMGILSSIG
jgi:type IV pilus assembly protein PilC